MALIVEGKMPTCCGLCCECLGGGSDAYYCNRAKRQISEVVPPYDKRMEWCPIIGEIPNKHGRLIDADELLATMIMCRNNDNNGVQTALTGLDDITLVRIAPTILEATE